MSRKVSPVLRLRLKLLGCVILLLTLGGCLSPVAMHRAVLEYDRTVSRVETELLLLNIARVRHYHPIHFTAISSIAATFDFQVRSSVVGIPLDPVTTGNPPLSLRLGTSVSENPTISIIPVRGAEFTRRILTPIYENKLPFLIGQGIDPSIILRLVARGIILDGYGESGFLLNQPNRDQEYREFRRRILHLASLKLARKVRFDPVRFMDGSEEIIGRNVITNYSANKLSNDERRSLHEAAQRYPANFIFVDIRPGDPGGDYPLRGAIQIRSFKGILGFIARGIAEEPEFHVEKDPRTGPVLINPQKTLAIRETETRPDDAVFAVEEQGFWYSVDPMLEGGQAFARWNREAFDVLYQLFQLTVTDVAQVPAPSITISK